MSETKAKPTCATCTWFIPYTEGTSTEPSVGECRRMPRAETVFSYHWCGEHPEFALRTVVLHEQAMKVPTSLLEGMREAPVYVHGAKPDAIRKP